MLSFCVLFAIFVCSEATFSFQDCNHAGALVRFSSFAMPDVVPNGGRYKVTANIAVSSNLPGNVVVANSISKHIIGPVYMPFATCQDDFGDCKMNLCQRPGFPTFNPLFYKCVGSGSSTSVPAGTYNVAEDVFFPGLTYLEGIIVNGDYRGSVTMKSGDQEVGCFTWYFSVGDSTNCPK